ncbi:hypothetical protein LTR10_013394 [Elasticomyces elasticus]|uniref:Xylanolytic transcriptional activator regulatory domain-containing protein n=1 Tax=Exophiala sideris TaxID=1016849 RepID=A0ABR0J4H6_9EURO|nr:hypothetical protein LTR10_013394 [Elasticomyces elasticus]KAK5027376.1 hypothetical protein LTS07_006978 [Exophiala sideris]KAK5034922.1 hypothetical protein LTR13_006104 [Exophiala sideris]KAK5056344.1 hypothetical protein LTR69_007885 [Exophiala sideris]KAK5181167.1 hypothetical protein LTR44_006498 [Eurotiomycetes sp. CCFEE 6388]
MTHIEDIRHRILNLELLIAKEIGDQRDGRSDSGHEPATTLETRPRQTPAHAVELHESQPSNVPPETAASLYPSEWHTASFTDPLNNAEKGPAQADMDMHGNQNSNTEPDVAMGLEPSGTYSDIAIPSTYKTWVLVQEFLQDFNRAIPLFDEDWVTNVFSQDSGDAETPENLLIATNIILAIAHRLRGQSPASEQEDDLNATAHLNYACLRVSRLIMQEPSLLQVQCLIGIAIAMEGAQNPEPASTILSAAVRCAVKLVSTSPRTEKQSSTAPSQLKLVCRIAFFMDTSMSLRGQLPRTLNFEHLDNTLLSDDLGQQSGIIRTLDNKYFFNILQLHVQLALVQAKVMDYILPSKRISPNHIRNDSEFQLLCQEYRAWRLSFADIETLLAIHAALHRSDIVHILILEAKAFETLCALYLTTRPQMEEILRAQLAFAKSEFDDIEDDCLLMAEARRFLKLQGLAPIGDVACNR